MINESMFSQPHLVRLKGALEAYSLRHRVVADNLANVGTEGFRAQMVEFEERMDASAKANIKGRVTRPGHLPIGQGKPPGPAQMRRVGDGFDNGVNDVNVDREMGELVKNDLAFRLATRLLGRKYQGLRQAITGHSQ